MLKFRKLKNATHHLELGEMGFLAVERVKRMWVSPSQLRKPPMCGCIIISADGSWRVGVMLGRECDFKWCHTLRVKNQVEGLQELFQHFDARCLSVACSGPKKQYVLPIFLIED